MNPIAILDTSKVIVGASGSGKTVTAKADVEQLLDEHRHLVVIDPTGVWWGMRSTAAGNKPGFDLPIFGGKHGDVPIRPGQGAAIARIIVEQRVSAIVDLSAIDNSRDWRRFMADFVAELRRRVRGNFHLVVDEADEFAAERAADDVGFALREDLVWIAKRGRAAGFVPTWITQRTAEIAKAVISQAQTIVAHQLIAPTDRKAIDDYLKGHGTAEARTEVMGSLAELGVGERWVYSPRLKVLERGVTPALRTFDSSRTPAPGERLAAPRTLAQLDVSAIAAALAPPAAEPPADPADPAVAYRAGAAASDAIVWAHQRIVELEEQVASRDARIETLDFVARRALTTAGRITVDVEQLLALIDQDHEDLHHDDASSGFAPDLETTDGADMGAAPAVEEAPPTSGASDTTLRRGRKALVPLAQIHPAAISETQWATLAKLAKSGGTWSTYRSALRAAGLIRQDTTGLWQATTEGCAVAGVVPAKLPPIGPDRARFWGERVQGARRMVEILVKRWPHFTTREALAADLNMAASGGTFSTYLGRLRSNGLLDEQKQRVRLGPEVMGKP